MNLDQLVQLEYAKLCQLLGDVETKIALLKEDSQLIKNKILSLSRSKKTLESAVQNLATLENKSTDDPPTDIPPAA